MKFKMCCWATFYRTLCGLHKKTQPMFYHYFNMSLWLLTYKGSFSMWITCKALWLSSRSKSLEANSGSLHLSCVIKLAVLIQRRGMWKNSSTWHPANGLQIIIMTIWIVYSVIITFLTEWWSCRQTQPSQQGSRRGATGTLHCQFSSPCHNNRRITQSTAGSPVEKKIVSIIWDHNECEVCLIHLIICNENKIWSKCC